MKSALCVLALSVAATASAQSVLSENSGAIDQNSEVTAENGSAVLTAESAVKTTVQSATLEVPMREDGSTAEGQRYPDRVLRVVNKSAKSLDVGLLVVGALLGSFRMPSNKEEYKGSKVDTLFHPATKGFFQPITEVIKGWGGERKPNIEYKNPLYVRADTFSLVYADYGDETPAYDLYVQTTISRKRDSGGWFTRPASVVCRDKYSEPALTLAQWEADDYAVVKARSAEHIGSCVKQVQAALDELLKD